MSTRSSTRPTHAPLTSSFAPYLFLHTHTRAPIRRHVPDVHKLGTLYYSLGGNDNIIKAALAALTWAAGGRTAEVCLISFMMMVYDPTYNLPIIYWHQKKVSDTKLVPVIAAWPPSSGGSPLSAAMCPLYALGSLAAAGLFNLRPSAVSTLGVGKFVFPSLAGKADSTQVGYINGVL